jgi:hypothetical protein
MHQARAIDGGAVLRIDSLELIAFVGKHHGGDATAFDRERWPHRGRLRTGLCALDRVAEDADLVDLHLNGVTV